VSVRGRPGIPWIASILLLGFALVALLAPLIAHSREGRGAIAVVPYAPTDISLADRLQPPSRSHWLGTDELGRDVLSRLVHGSRTSLLVASVAALVSLAIGTLLGALAGYFGGWLDWTISRLIEVVLAFPFLILLLVIIAVLGPSVWSIILALVLTGWVSEARFVRGEMLRLRESEFAQAARAMGAGHLRLIARHLLPAAMAPALVSATFGAATAILVESALSFLGFGVQLPRTSWGMILASGREYVATAWWLVLFPGLAIFITVASIHSLAQWLDDRGDPVRTVPPR
jgi:peptide/nickel transport system permease protein